MVERRSDDLRRDGGRAGLGGFRVQVEVWGLGIRVQGEELGFRVQGLGFSVEGLGF